MNSGGVTGNDSPTPGNLFDEFEQAFQNCLAPLTKEDPLNGIELDELRTISEVNSQRFLDLAHKMDAAFLQKRFLLSVQKPELLIMEENHEMRVEMGRKDELIKKQTDKLTEWQNTLMNLINRVGSVPAAVGNRTTNPGIANTQSSLPPIHISPGNIGGGPPTGQSPMSAAPNSMNMSGPGNHGLNVSPHSMGSTMTSHQNMVGQVSSSGAAPAGPAGQQGNFQPMNTMSGQAPQMHMGGPPNQGGNMSPNVGGGHRGGPTGGGMFSVGMGNMGQSMGQSQGGLQGPLAYLEKTTTNIGMPDSSRR